MENTMNRKEPALAAFLSFFIAGLGHIYCGQVTKGIIFIIVDIVLWFTIVGAIAFGIFAMIDSYNIAKDINFQIDQVEKNKNKKTKTALDNAKKLKEETEQNANDFFEDLKKLYKLFATEIYSEEEYNIKKKAIINNLATKKTTCSSEDFLAALIPLKEQNILKIEEINKIKLLIM